MTLSVPAHAYSSRRFFIEPFARPNFPFSHQFNPLTNRDSAAAAKPSGNRGDSAGHIADRHGYRRSWAEIGQRFSGDL